MAEGAQDERRGITCVEWSSQSATARKRTITKKSAKWICWRRCHMRTEGGAERTWRRERWLEAGKHLLKEMDHVVVVAVDGR